jgi:hypothetical protein
MSRAADATRTTAYAMDIDPPVADGPRNRSVKAKIVH